MAKEKNEEKSLFNQRLRCCEMALQHLEAFGSTYFLPHSHGRQSGGAGGAYAPPLFLPRPGSQD